MKRDGGRKRVFPERARCVTYLVFVARQVHGEVAVPGVPDLECAVLAACDQQPAVG